MNNGVEILQMVMYVMLEGSDTQYCVVTATTTTDLQAFIAFYSYFSPDFTCTSGYDLNQPIQHKFKSSS